MIELTEKQLRRRSREIAKDLATKPWSYKGHRVAWLFGNATGYPIEVVTFGSRESGVVKLRHRETDQTRVFKYAPATVGHCLYMMAGELTPTETR